MIVAFMTVKYHSINIIVTSYRIIMNVLSHYHKDMIVIEPSQVVLVIFESVCRRISVLKEFRIVFFNIY